MAKDENAIYVAKIEKDLGPKEVAWSEVDGFELTDVTSGRRVAEKAIVKIGWSENFLYVFFEVCDKHIWGTYKQNDDPIWKEEVVEVFLSFGADTPKKYCELQFSPLGVKYDAWVSNTSGDRQSKDFHVDTTWDLKGMEFAQSIKGEGDEIKRGVWETYVKIPSVVLKGREFIEGDLLRGNFFRIDGYPKQESFQALWPNFEKTPNFHTPQKFGAVVLG